MPKKNSIYLGVGGISDNRDFQKKYSPGKGENLVIVWCVFKYLEYVLINI